MFTNKMDNEKIEQILTEFFKEYMDWINAGASESSLGFRRSVGLCGNLCFYLDTIQVTNLHPRHDILFELSLYLDKQPFPFNSCDSLAYFVESSKNACHTNELRLQFVKDQLKQRGIEYEKENSKD